jgi:uncharacterized protein YutE (UPF0331/DUF86 family)
MANDPPRKADIARWQREIVDHLGDFPRQHAALETAMAAFGETFELKQFKAAYETRTDMEAYNRAQAIERALGRVQNYVADLAIAGVKLAGLEVSVGGDEGAAQRAFATLREATVIDGALCRRLSRAQKARSMVEHSYVEVPAGTVHRAAELIHESSREFIGPYRSWIGELL